MKSFRKGNKIVAVHINGIAAKDRTTKDNGINPLRCLGVTYSATGLTATLWHFAGDENFGTWVN